MTWVWLPVSVLCQDRRVYDAMEMAGTPCPFLGKIGDQQLMSGKQIHTEYQLQKK